MSREDFHRFDFSNLRESRWLSKENPAKPKLNLEEAHHLKRDEAKARDALKNSQLEERKVIMMLAHALSPQRDIELQALLTASEVQSGKVRKTIEDARNLSQKIDESIEAAKAQSAAIKADTLALSAGLFHRRCPTPKLPPLPRTAIRVSHKP